MTAQYTPTTEQVRIAYIGTREEFVQPYQEARPEEFDRWLAAHDAQVRAEVLREAANGLMATDPVETALSGIDFPIGWLRAEANRIDDANPNEGSTDD